MSDEIEVIVLDDAIAVARRSERLAAHLYALPDHGVPQAVACLMTTADAGVAAFVTEYLAIVPGRRHEKEDAARRLRAVPALAGAAARLVPWLSAPLLQGFIADYLANPDDSSPVASVVFDIARFHPALLRPHADHIHGPAERKGMMSGAPDAWVDGHIARWHADRDEDALDLVARIRTRYAADALAGVRDEVDDVRQLDTWIEMAGKLPDGTSPSMAMPSFAGFVVAKGHAPHVMGGAWAGRVPGCPVCNRPSERVLTLARHQLPFALRSDPSFFWYACQCDALDFTSAQIRDDGLKVFFGPEAEGGPGGAVVPAECAMTLEAHANQHGISIDSTGDLGAHQIGGLPNWITPIPLPHCPGCQRLMLCIATVDSGVTPFGRLGFAGSLFCFWCDDCAIGMTQRQS